MFGVGDFMIAKSNICSFQNGKPLSEGWAASGNFFFKDDADSAFFSPWKCFVEEDSDLVFSLNWELDLEKETPFLYVPHWF